MMKAYHKALDTIDKGLAIDPQNQDLAQAKMKTMSSIHTGNSGNDQERMAQAASDPEIQQLIKDPRIQQTLKDL